MKKVPIPIAIMSLNEAKALQAKLKDQGIEVFLNHEKKTCTRGCSITVELHAMEEDIPRISEISEEEFRRLGSGHGYNWENLNHIFNPDAKEATCPACNHKFSPVDEKILECPDCGLYMG